MRSAARAAGVRAQGTGHTWELGQGMCCDQDLLVSSEGKHMGICAEVAGERPAQVHGSRSAQHGKLDGSMCSLVHISHGGVAVLAVVFGWARLGEAALGLWQCRVG